MLDTCENAVKIRFTYSTNVYPNTAIIDTCPNKVKIRYPSKFT